jgi:hypothetical protein
VNQFPELMHRWAEVIELERHLVQCRREWGDPGVQQRLCGQFDRVFQSPARMLAFWEEVRSEGAQGTDWGSGVLVRMAHRLQTTSTLDQGASTEDLLPGEKALLQALQRHVSEQRRWPDTGGIDFVLQQITPSSSRPWTSIPMWFADIGAVQRCVHAGHLLGQPRWAVAIGCAGEEPAFLCGLDGSGRPMDPSQVRQEVGAVASLVDSISLPSAEQVHSVVRQRAAGA